LKRYDVHARGEGNTSLRYSRIEISTRPDQEDPAGRHIAWEIASTLGFQVRGVRTVLVYTLYTDLADAMIQRFASEVLCDPVISIYAVDSPVGLQLPPFAWAVEVCFKLGVTDNVGHTAAEVLSMMTGEEDGSRIYTSTQYLIDAELEREQVELIGDEILYNSLIEDVEILSIDEYRSGGGFSVRERHIEESHKPRTKEIDLTVSDRELKAISAERTLALTLEEMKYFASYYEHDDVVRARRRVGLGNRPTDVELEAFAQTQSEHCKHKIFNASIDYSDGERHETVHSLFKTCIRGATEKIAQRKDFLVSVFEDNAGVIRFNESHNLAFKVETHNSPSALDPYGGSITGIVGCDRDPAGTGLGSRLIAHTDVLCFGNPSTEGELPPRMMHPKRIMEGVVKGIEDGGNKCGIPTINGAVIFDDAYSGKPLVFCGSVGIMPRVIGKHQSHVKEILPGDVIVMTGGRIGKDGIHGATFSSEEISESSPVQAVQIGDPITQKKMLDMILEARDRLLYRAITDNGAGGLSSSVGEMAQLSGGARLMLDRAPLKYPGLDPWEILLSEAQERMTLAVPQEKLDAFLELAASRDVLAVPMGSFTDTGYFHVTYDGETVCYLELSFLHSSIPMSLEAAWSAPNLTEKLPPKGRSLNHRLLEMISDLNTCSREPIIRRYDHEVGGSAVVKALVGGKECGPSDGGVIAPIPGDWQGFVLSAGINPFYSEIDTYHMAANAVDEALRNAVGVGADPERVALLDNFCWPDPVYDPVKTPDGRHKLAQLVRAARGCHDAAVAYGTPFISGKDSMKNDYKIGDHKVSVLPTILISAIGVIPDIRNCISSDFKCPGDSIYVLGTTRRELGQSLFLRLFGGSSGSVPEVNCAANLKLYKLYHGLTRQGLLASGHDLSEGGLAVALMESCLGSGCGASVDLRACMSDLGLSAEELLFSESAGRFVVSLDPASEEQFLAAAADAPLARIGVVTESPTLEIRGEAGCSAALAVSEIASRYREPLYGILGMKMEE
jgi:phosphoribosylformylglycinamidine synthase